MRLQLKKMYRDKTVILFFFILYVSISSNGYRVRDERSERRNARIASGVPAITGENLDYALLTIVFQSQRQICGGVLIEPRYVLTTASCVSDVKEGVATVVNVTFPHMSPTFTHTRVFIHEGYDSMTYANNLAIVKLSNVTVPDGKVLMTAKLSLNDTTDAYVNQQVRVCGFGSVANYLTYPKTMMCTHLFVQPASVCSALPKTICTLWSDRENNVCSSDYGSPIYTYIYAGTTIIQRVIGLASHSPDYRKNAPCYDGHKVVHVQVGAYADWIESTVDALSLNDPIP